MLPFTSRMVLSCTSVLWTALCLVGLPHGSAHAQSAAAKPAASQEPLRVALFSGSEEYKSDRSLAEFKAHLEKTCNVRCSLNCATRLDDLPGLEQLASCDVAVIYTRRVRVPQEQLELIKRYCAAGKPIVAIRTASHAFQTWLEFDKEVLGGSYNGHYGTDRRADVTLVDQAKDHPVLAGIRPFVTQGKLYKNPALAADAVVLLRASAGDYAEPVAWVRQHRGGRVFYTSLGVPDDFRDENFRRLLTNAIFWAGGRAVMTR